jgi:hypothetical protein
MPEGQQKTLKYLPSEHKRVKRENKGINKPSIPHLPTYIVLCRAPYESGRTTADFY